MQKQEWECAWHIKLLASGSSHSKCFQFGVKFKNPGFGQLRKETRENPFFSGFEMNAILSDKNSISL